MIVDYYIVCVRVSNPNASQPAASVYNERDNLAVVAIGQIKMLEFVRHITSGGLKEIKSFSTNLLTVVA